MQLRISGLQLEYYAGRWHAQNARVKQANKLNGVLHNVEP